MAGTDDFQRLVAYIAVGWTFLCVSLWGVLMTVPFHWHSKLTLWYTVDAGLWSVKLSHGVVTGAIQETLPDDAKAWVKRLVWKTEPIQEFQHRMCAPLYRNTAKLTGSNVCQIWISFMQGTYAFIFLTILGCIFLIVGSTLTWRHYMWNITRSKYRTCMKAFVIAGPACITCGLIFYVALTQDFADMPPRRVRAFGANWGTCTGMACILTLFSYGPMLLSFCCLTTSSGELFGDEEHERKKLAAQFAFGGASGLQHGQGAADLYGGTAAHYVGAAQYGAAAPPPHFEQGLWQGAQPLQGSWQGAPPAQW